MTTDQMTQEKWNACTPAQKDAVRDNSGLSPQLVGLEGWRVEVLEANEPKPRRFIVGKSTGWRPCHLEISRRSAHGGMAASREYLKVTRLYKAR